MVGQTLKNHYKNHKYIWNVIINGNKYYNIVINILIFRSIPFIINNSLTSSSVRLHQVAAFFFCDLSTFIWQRGPQIFKISRIPGLCPFF